MADEQRGILATFIVYFESIGEGFFGTIHPNLGQATHLLNEELLRRKIDAATIVGISWNKAQHPDSGFTSVIVTRRAPDGK